MGHHHQRGSHRHEHGDHSHLSRREVLMGLSAAGIAAALPPISLSSVLHPAPAVQQNSAPLFRIERVTDGIYAAKARPTAMINCNAAIVVTADHVLVVDSHSKPSAARALIGQIRAEVTDRPVRYIVNSHFHWDHAQGNLAYPEAYGPGTQIVSSTGTREWLEREGVKRLRQSLEDISKEVADLKKKMGAAKTESERKRLSEQTSELEAYKKEMTPAEAQIKLPTLTFEQRLVLHHGGKEIHLLFLGKGHTAGDVVVHVPGDRVVATGDLMHSVLPFMGDGFPEDWGRTLTAVEGLNFDRVLPGHGSVQEGKSVLVFFRTYIDELNEGVSRGVERGTSLKDLQRSLAPGRLKSMSANDHLARLGREVESAFGPTADMNASLNEAVATNVAEVFNYYTKRRKS